MRKCDICDKEFPNKNPIKRFCSLKCKNKSGNKKYQNYSNQQSRGEKRKIELIKIRGGGCEVCGYNKNYAALQFNHLDPSVKSHQLDLRSLSNRSMDAVMKEFAKCNLLCANCHAEYHHPGCLLPK